MGAERRAAVHTACVSAGQRGAGGVGCPEQSQRFSLSSLPVLRSIPMEAKPRVSRATSGHFWECPWWLAESPLLTL